MKKIDADIEKDEIFTLDDKLKKLIK